MDGGGQQKARAGRAKNDLNNGATRQGQGRVEVSRTLAPTLERRELVPLAGD